MPNPGRGPNWTDADKLELSELIGLGLSPSKVAARLGRTPASVVSAAARSKLHFSSSATALPHHTDAASSRLLNAAPAPDGPPSPALLRLAEYDPLARRALAWRERKWTVDSVMPDEEEEA
jgi:hypothetical protein